MEAGQNKKHFHLMVNFVLLYTWSYLSVINCLLNIFVHFGQYLIMVSCYLCREICRSHEIYD